MGLVVLVDVGCVAIVVDGVVVDDGVVVVVAVVAVAVAVQEGGKVHGSESCWIRERRGVVI